MKVIIKEMFIILGRGSHRLIVHQDGIGKDKDKEVGKEDKEDKEGKEESTIIISDRMKVAQKKEHKEQDKETTVNNNTPPQPTTMA